MNNKKPNLVPELNFESGIPGESALAYNYFEMYRDAGPERNLRMLCDSEIGGKKRSVAQIGRWSSQFHWQTRVEAYDAHVAHAAFAKLAQQRRDEITKFIDNDMSIAINLQNLCSIRLNKLIKDGEEADCKELRQLALTYRESRLWLMELTGILSDRTHDEETTT